MYIYDGDLLVTVFFRDKDLLVSLAYRLVKRWIALLSSARILITIQRIKVLGKNQLRSIQWIEIHPLDGLWIELSS